MIKHFLFLILSLASPLYLLADEAKPEYDNIEMTIVLQYPDTYINSVLDTEELLKWTGLSKDTVEAAIHSYKTDHTINIITVLRADQKPEYRINVFPANNAMKETLLSYLNKLPDLRTKYAIYAHQFVITLNKGGCDDQTCLGDIQLPAEEEKQFLKNATIAQSYQRIQEWARQNMKVFAANEVSVDDKFEGVLAVGALMEKDINTLDVYKSTSGNDMYWRAVMEMEKGNELIPMSMVMMYLAKGEIDRACSWTRLLSLFYKQKGSLARYMYEEVTWRIDLFNTKCSEQIQKGIEFHDKGKYKAALEIYQGVLKEYPNSAWAWHEYYLSSTAQNMKSTEADKDIWDQCSDSIYGADPMYPYYAHAKTGREGFYVYRRNEINLIFKKRENLKKDLLTYAEIAMDLGNYDYAAETYWYLMGNVDPKELGKKNFLPYYLFCMKKLNHTSVINFFQDDYSKDYIRIEKEMDKRLKSSPIYNSFKDKE